MAKTENAPDAVAAASEAVEALSENQTTPKTSETDIITELTNPQDGIIYRLLERGEENALSTATIKKILNVDERTVREYVERERRSGALILAAYGKPSGYYLPDTGQKGIEEMKRSFFTAKSKALGALVAVSPVYHELKRLGALAPQEIGQISIDEIEKAEETQEDG